jgi:hypothetical protein
LSSKFIALVVPLHLKITWPFFQSPQVILPSIRLKYGRNDYIYENGTKELVSEAAEET